MTDDRSLIPRGIASAPVNDVKYRHGEARDSIRPGHD
jgi:hypothetical protein